MQEAFRECHGLQCGFCTPGMIMQSVDLLKENPNPSEEEIRLGLEGNLCRCTGYHNIVRAVQHAAGRGGGDVVTATELEREIGRDRRRKEDQRLITGRTRWTDNLELPGMLHLAMVRSPFAHARITSIDTSAAKSAPNVVAVLTGADFGDELGVCINAWPITPDQVTPGALADARRPGRLRRRDRRRRRRPLAPPRRATPPSSSTSSTTSCRPPST